MASDQVRALDGQERMIDFATGVNSGTAERQPTLACAASLRASGGQIWPMTPRGANGGLGKTKGAEPSGSAQLAGGQGFEPHLADPESAVLPLDDPPTDTCIISSWQFVGQVYLPSVFEAAKLGAAHKGIPPQCGLPTMYCPLAGCEVQTFAEHKRRVTYYRKEPADGLG